MPIIVPHKDNGLTIFSVNLSYLYQRRWLVSRKFYSIIDQILHDLKQTLSITFYHRQVIGNYQFYRLAYLALASSGLKNETYVFQKSVTLEFSMLCFPHEIDIYTPPGHPVGHSHYSL